MPDKHSQNTSYDYLDPYGSIGFWLTTLPAVLTNKSGYIVIGLIGVTWRQGVQAMWITFGFYR